MTPAQQARLNKKLNSLLIAIGDAVGPLTYAHSHAAVKQFVDARSELANASNAIDEAMGLIDELLAPEPTREEREP